jgi:hypothetical protein
MLIAAPLCVVAIAASVAVATPSDAESTQGPKLDKLHAERPIAASESIVGGTIPEVAILQAVNDLHHFLYAVEAERVRLLDEYIAAVIAEEAAAAAAPRRTSSVSSNSAPGGFLSCIRQRESGGDYGVYNAGGSGAAGAYQFMPGTWNSVAASTGRHDLVGVDPAQAHPGDQDAMAAALYAQQGSAPWGGHC